MSGGMELMHREEEKKEKTAKKIKKTKEQRRNKIYLEIGQLVTKVMDLVVEEACL